jgi:hypothetical protein
MHYRLNTKLSRNTKKLLDLPLAILESLILLKSKLPELEYLCNIATSLLSKILLSEDLLTLNSLTIIIVGPNSNPNLIFIEA